MTSNICCDKKVIRSAMQAILDLIMMLNLEYIQTCMQMEDTLKKKYTDLVKNMSHLELTTFSKGECQKRVLSELSKSLPNIDGSKLKVTAPMHLKFA